MAINFVQIHKVIVVAMDNSTGGRAPNRRGQRGSNRSGFSRTLRILLKKI